MNESGTQPSGVPLISSDASTQRGNALMMFRVVVAVAVVVVVVMVGSFALSALICVCILL